jgi:Response regulator containing a CheY-like receiver domain and an HTH DNA-binding domain
MIVDDHGIVRTGLRALLQPEPDMAIVGEAGSVKEAVKKANELKPDVVLMDVNLPDGSGIEATRLIKESCPETQVLMLTVYDDQETVLKAVQAGAIGYVLKDIPPEYLIRAIRSVHTNGTMINPSIARKMVERLASTERDVVLANFRRGPGLTDREIEVLKEVAAGLSDKEIALKLYLSEPTIKSHLRSIYQKLRVRNRAQAAAYAVRHGLG